jgi:YVTN family beta-propeller protein
VKIDLMTRQVVGYLTLDPDKWTNYIPRQISRLLNRRKKRNSVFAALMNVPSMPQDIRSSADGSKFYVADMKEDGVFVIDPQKFKRIAEVRTWVTSPPTEKSCGSRVGMTTRCTCSILRPES